MCSECENVFPALLGHEEMSHLRAFEQSEPLHCIGYYLRALSRERCDQRAILRACRKTQSPADAPVRFSGTAMAGRRRRGLNGRGARAGPSGNSHQELVIRNLVDGIACRHE
jgi:hypothetical protein